VRIRRVLVLLLVVTTAGLLSGAGAGAAPTAAAAVAAVVGAVPERYLGAPEPAPETVPDAAAALAPEPVQQVVRQAGATMVAVRVAPVIVPGTPCRSTARACVDLSSNQAWLLADGAVTYGPVPITSGRKGFRTPAGTFSVDFHSRDHVSSIYDAPMPYSVFFNGGIAFHQGSLSEQSHGCIHLSRPAAKEFFASLDRGDAVQVVS
jgi:lipoprotein-anchoring transpeptidase ErfK/SrfK